jgi:hypothetical protein
MSNIKNLEYQLEQEVIKEAKELIVERDKAQLDYDKKWNVATRSREKLYEIKDELEVLKEKYPGVVERVLEEQGDTNEG